MADAPVYQNLIDGEWLESRSRKTFENRNPADGRELIGLFQDSTEEDVDQAVNSALTAYQQWRLTPAPKRGKTFSEWAKSSPSARRKSRAT